MHNRKHQISTPAAHQDNPNASSVEPQRPDPEVVASAKRRVFSKAEKLHPGCCRRLRGAKRYRRLLRREGIYSFHLATWRKQRQLADEASAMERKRGPKTNPGAAEARRVRELEKEVESLRAKLIKADLIIDVQKKTFHSAGPEHRRHAERAEMFNAASALAEQVGAAASCRALRLPRSALYRAQCLPTAGCRHRCIPPASATGAVGTGTAGRARHAQEPAFR